MNLHIHTNRCEKIVYINKLGLPAKDLKFVGRNSMWVRLPPPRTKERMARQLRLELEA